MTSADAGRRAAGTSGRGLGVLLRLRARRDGAQLALWILGTAALAALGHVGVTQSYGTPTDRQEVLGAALADPVILMFRGLPSGASEGAFVAFEILPWLAMLAALMSTFLAVRHTRGDEENGRAELVAATPAGRVTPLVATIVHGVGANLVLAALTALALIATGLDAGGSILAGAAAGATGVAFLGVGLVAGQLLRTARGANALAIWVLVAAFLLRGLGNVAGTPSDDLTRVSSAWPAWLSPFGWAEQTRPYDADRWWPAALAFGAGILLAAAATALTARRDLGAGFVPERRGRTHARAGLRTAHALVWRLAAPSIVGWALAGALTGLLATSLGSVVDRIAGQDAAVSQILTRIAGGGSTSEAVVAVFFTVLGILAACCAVQTVARARQDEAHGTAELLRAAPVGRVRWLAAYVVVATCAVALVVAAAMLAAYAGIAASGGDGGLLRVVTVAGLGQLAAASVFTVLTVLVLVVVPRLTIGAGWSLVLVATVLGLFGPLLGLPDWSTDASPFAVAPTVGGGQVELRGLWWLLLAVAAGAAASSVLMRRRELAGAE